MSKSKIVILGDSTSISLGRAGHNYVDMMANTACWPAEFVFENLSFPGATSHDMLEAFKGLVSTNLNGVFAVIINLGNCDSASSPLMFKTRFIDKFFPKSAGKFSDRERLSMSRNRFTPFYWNENYDPLIEVPVSPKTFQTNIETIVTSCLKRGVKVSLVKPVANRHFPPGLGKGNCFFYHYLGLNDKISHRLNISDTRFIEATREKEEGRYAKAASLYENILDNLSENINSREYPLLIANNYAVCLAEDNKFREAKSVLEILLSERHMRKEIVLYNLSQIEKKLGNSRKADFYERASFEADFSLYRIKDAYRAQLDAIVKRHNSLEVVDLIEFLSSISFCDHCHLDENSHQILAQKLMEKLHKDLENSEHKASVVNNPLSPMASKRDFRNFFVFNSAFEPDEVVATDQLLHDLDENLDLQKDSKYSNNNKLNKTISEYKQHPITSNKSLLLAFEPNINIFWGKFPEYSIAYRLFQLTSSYSKEANRLFETFPNLFGHLNLRRQSKFLAPLFNEEPKLAGQKFSRLALESDYDELEKEIDTRINKIYSEDWEPDNRVKMTLVWYVRESLRFGGQSRFNSLCEFWELEKMAEALFVMMLSAQVKRGKISQSTRQVASKLENLMIFFEHYSNDVWNHETQIDQEKLCSANLKKSNLGFHEASQI